MGTSLAGKVTRSQRSKMNRPETIEGTAALVDEAAPYRRPPGFVRSRHRIAVKESRRRYAGVFA